MDELDLALNFKHKGDIVISVLVGIQRSELESALPAWQEEWKAISAKGLERANQIDVARWARYLKRLTERPCIDIEPLRKGTTWDWAREIASAISRHTSQL